MFTTKKRKNNLVICNNRKLFLQGKLWHLIWQIGFALHWLLLPSAFDRWDFLYEYKFFESKLVLFCLMIPSAQYNSGREGGKLPSTLLGSTAGTREIKLTKEKLTRETKQLLLTCAVHIQVGETGKYLKGVVRTWNLTKNNKFVVK